MNARVGRNDPCPCGSGKKFKKCCYEKIVNKKFEARQIANTPAGMLGNLFKSATTYQEADKEAAAAKQAEKETPKEES